MPINDTKSSDTAKGGKMLEDPRLSRNNVRVPRREDYEKRPVLSENHSP